MIMKLKDMLPKKYIELGFELSKFGEKSLILKYNNNIIFIFGSYLDVRDDYVSKLCDYYLKLLIPVKTVTLPESDLLG